MAAETAPTTKNKIKNLIVTESSRDPGEEIVDIKSALVGYIKLTFAHIADFQTLVVKIIADKYKIPIDELLEVIQTHPDYMNMNVEPMIDSLGYFTNEDVKKVLKKDEAAVTKIEETHEEPPKMLVRIKKKVLKKSE